MSNKNLVYVVEDHRDRGMFIGIVVEEDMEVSKELFNYFTTDEYDYVVCMKQFQENDRGYISFLAWIYEELYTENELNIGLTWLEPNTEWDGSGMVGIGMTKSIFDLDLMCPVFDSSDVFKMNILKDELKLDKYEIKTAVFR